MNDPAGPEGTMPQYQPRNVTSFPRGPAQEIPTRGRGQQYHRGQGRGGGFRGRGGSSAPATAPIVPLRRSEFLAPQVSYLDDLVRQIIPTVELTRSEWKQMVDFKEQLEKICSTACHGIKSIKLFPFGSFASGFATQGSDIDLTIIMDPLDQPTGKVSPQDQDIARLLEKALLNSNIGAHFLANARVPILKVCQYPTQELYRALLEARSKQDGLPVPEESLEDAEEDPQPLNPASSTDIDDALAKISINARHAEDMRGVTPSALTITTDHMEGENDGKAQECSDMTKKSSNGDWRLGKAPGPLDFPQTGVGIHCDLNFNNCLGMANTKLLHCYSLCDHRVKPMVLLIKTWAKRRKISNARWGTLSSYGWVLMVLNYLVNIAQPPVCPNLQLAQPPPFAQSNVQDQNPKFLDMLIDGCRVRFWCDPEQIKEMARVGRLTRNQQTIGELLYGFFYYYNGTPPNIAYGPRPRSFHWFSEVVSLRTRGGVLLKRDKNWVKSTTTIVGDRTVKNSYLLAIEDPFEIEHNVARTVVSRGVKVIRAEFQRVCDILSAKGRSELSEGELLDELAPQTGPIQVMPKPAPPAQMPVAYAPDPAPNPALTPAPPAQKPLPQSAPERPQSPIPCAHNPAPNPSPKPAPRAQKPAPHSPQPTPAGTYRPSPSAPGRGRGRSRFFGAPPAQQGNQRLSPSRAQGDVVRTSNRFFGPPQVDQGDQNATTPGTQGRRGVSPRSRFF